MTSIRGAGDARVTDVRDLSQIIKAYDVRGVYPDQLDAELAAARRRRVRPGGRQQPAAPAGPGAVVVGRDMRPSGPELVAAFCEGVTGQGVDVVDIGLASTDQLYFAAGRLDAARGDVHRQPQPGAVQRDQAVPRRRDAGRPGVRAGRDPRARRRADPARRSSRRAASSTRDLLADYAAFLHGLVDLTGIRPLTGRRRRGQRHGRAHRAGRSSTSRASTIIPLYFELDGTFPNHEANPIEPENLRDLQTAVSRARRRHRPGLRRRCRPVLRRRRAGRAGVALGPHRR